MRTVLVTGSSRGIGLAVAEAFCSSGARVALNCSNDFSAMEAEAARLERINPCVMAVKADVSDYAEARRLFAEVNGRFGDIDILVNNAGIAYYGLFSDMAPADWKRVMDNNVNSAFNCVSLAVKPMIRKKKGVIINISSVWGDAGASCEAVYSASKGAVNAFTKSMAKELAPSGIRVNAIACGAINTGMNSRLSDEERETLLAEIPAGRFGEPSEIAALALFLASDSAAYINGQIIAADGGWM